MSEQSSPPPVLVLAFNRPEITAKVLASIRKARPRRLFLAVDGPRPNQAGERERVSAVQRLVQTIDWPCETRTLFRESNLGCKMAVSEAITWFFDQVEEGIILEDDCVPDLSFFNFAGELLERYRNAERVSMISGDNFQFGRRRTQYSYYFSIYSHVWGWATWRRAWNCYDHQMAAWPQLRERGWLREILRDRNSVSYWNRIFEDTYHDRNNSWAYRWQFSSWANSGLTILPEVNLVSNEGFGPSATHTFGANLYAEIATRPMTFPMMHPPTMEVAVEADCFTARTMYNRSLKARLERKIRGVLRWAP